MAAYDNEIQVITDAYTKIEEKFKAILFNKEKIDISQQEKMFIYSNCSNISHRIREEKDWIKTNDT